VVATVRQEVARLGRILRELVDFARRRRDEATLVSVQSVVGDALRLLRHDRRMREVTVREEFDPETPPVFVIEDHLMQVVLNLLLNALDAMPAGGTLRIEVGTAGGQVALRVHDTGVGMDRAILARCFEPLFTTKDPDRGTGLGLSISRDIARATGGDIEMHSAPGRGTPSSPCPPSRPRRSRAAGAARAAPLVNARPSGSSRRGRRRARRARPVPRPPRLRGHRGRDEQPSSTGKNPTPYFHRSGSRGWTASPWSAGRGRGTRRWAFSS
jgi:hypothetical protein